MKEYNVTVKIRNNYLLTAMRQKGCQTIADLHRLSGVGVGIIGKMLNLKILPMTPKRGEWRIAVVQVAKVLGREPIELFPAEHLNVILETNTAETEMSIEEVNTLLIGDGSRPEHLMLPDEFIEKEDVSQSIQDILKTLSPREEEVVKMRFGLDGYNKHSLKWIGNHLDVTKERVRQIEAKALRKLRHPVRSDYIKKAGYEPTNGYEIRNNRERSKRWAEEEKVEKLALEETKLREEKEYRQWEEENREGLKKLKAEDKALVLEMSKVNDTDNELTKLHKINLDELLNLNKKNYDKWATKARENGHRV